MLQQIGEGSYATVYLAISTKTNKEIEELSFCNQMKILEGEKFALKNFKKENFKNQSSSFKLILNEIKA